MTVWPAGSSIFPTDARVFPLCRISMLAVASLRIPTSVAPSVLCEPFHFPGRDRFVPKVSGTTASGSECL
jgi:hypothetical protein